MVSDINGGPVARAEVRASRYQWWESSEWSPMEVANDQGEFSLWVDPGSVMVSAKAEGYAETTATGHAPGRFTLLLTPASGLSGTVVDARSGKPIAGAAVVVESDAWGRDDDAHDLSDAEGHFRVHPLTPGRYVATARTEHGYGRSEGSTLVGLGQEVQGVVVKVFAMARIVGKVMIAGEPPRACLEANVHFVDKLDNYLSAKVDPDGTIHLDGVVPGTYTPGVRCEGMHARDHYPPIVVGSEDVTGVVWEVESGATVRGTLRSRSGAPVSDTTLRASSVGGTRATGDYAGAQTNREGVFALRGLRGGSYEVNVLDTPLGVSPVGGYKLEVAPGAVLERDLVLEEAGSLTGLVIDAQGQPVAGVGIETRALANVFSASNLTGSVVRTDRAGAFLLEGLRPGEYRVSALRNGNVLRAPGATDDTQSGEKITVHGGRSTNVKLVVESQHGVIRGVVVDTGGGPIDDAFLSAARESDAAGAASRGVQATRWSWGDDKPVLTTPDGSFTIDNLAPGRYTVRAYRKGGGEAIAEHVALGATVRLAMKPTGSIAGSVRRAGGAPPEQLTVDVRDRKAGIRRGDTFFRTDGRFLVRDLPAGHFSVTVSSDGGQRLVEIDLAEGEAKAGLDLTLAELVKVTGRVVDVVTHEPVVGMRILAMPSSGGRISSRDDKDANITDTTGRFTLQDIPLGEMSFLGFSSAADTGYGTLQAVRTIAGSGTVDVGELAIPRRRLKEGQTAGNLGLRFKERAAGAPMLEQSLEVSFVDPAGPCAGLDVRAGDVIVAVDGIDVSAPNQSRAHTLWNAPVGTRITLTLQRGASVTVELAAP